MPEVGRLARRHAGGRLGAADRLPAPAAGAPRPRQGRRSRHPTSARCCSSTRTTSATSRARTSASGRATRTRASSCSRAAPTRSSGTSAPPRAITSCSRRGSPPENFRAGVAPMRGAMPVETGIPDRLGERRSRTSCASAASQGEPLGVDMADLVTIEALQRAGRPRHGRVSRCMLEARKIKTAQEIALLDQSAGLVDAVYEEIYRMLRPGRVRARDRRAGASAALRDGLGAGRGGQRRLGRPLQPASARLLRPAPAAGRPGVLRHHPLVHGLPDVLLPHVQRRRRQPRAARRVQAVPRVARRRDRARPARA